MAQQQVNPVQANFMARQNLLSSGVAMTKRLQPVKGTAGDTIKIPMLRMGITTGFMLHFTVPVEIGATAGVLSPVAPWNTAKRIVYQDFAGNERTRTNGFHLWAAQSMKQGDAMGVSPMMGQGVDLDYDTSIFSVPTAANSEGELRFSMYVPLAYDPNSDLTGSVLTSTNVGEHFVTVALADKIMSSDGWVSPYIGGDVTLGGDITVEAFQFFIQPQAMDINNLPQLDLSTIYGFIGNYESSDNIQTGSDKYIDFPNNRSIQSTMVTFQNGGQFTRNGADLNRIDLLANSNTYFREQTPRLVREMMRNIVNCDMPDGTYYIGSRRQPIATYLYANVQLQLAINEAKTGGPTRTITQFEVMYPSGAPLPGITIAA